MAVLIPELLTDLDAETAVLLEQLDALDESSWSTVTPADGWTVADQIVHLAFFDGAVTDALADPDRFRAELAAAMQRPGSFVDAIAAANAGRSGNEVLDWFRTARSTMSNAFDHADNAMRVPWYGPDMSVASALTARIMETWAHGQDVFDAFGAIHPVTPALRQVAHIGVRALPNSFVSHGRDVPTAPVRVELDGPDGSPWTWGPDDATDRVTGPAGDFCLIVTQRRHPDDTAIVTDGPVASEWIGIAQAFAGPPGRGRRPGQFPRP